MRNQRMFQDFLFLLNIDGFRFFQEKEEEEKEEELERERGGPKGRPSQRENSIQ